MAVQIVRALAVLGRGLVRAQGTAASCVADLTARARRAQPPRREGLAVVVRGLEQQLVAAHLRRHARA